MRCLFSVAAIGAALTMAACSSGPSWDSPGRTVSTNSSSSTNSPSMNSSMNTSTPNDTMVSAQDKDFVMNAAWGGAYEIQSSRIALQKTQDPRVRMIAQMMIRDHTDVGHQLEALAQKKGLTASEMPSGDQQQMIAKLNNLGGTDFDQEYLSQQKAAHEQTIDLFKKEIADGSDPDVKFFATNNLAIIQTHLRHITTEDNTAMEQK